MNKSDSIKELATALAAVQAEMPHVQMNAVNPFLKNKFADLGAVITTARPVLQKYGVSYSQLPFSENGKVGITTIVMHKSGEWIESSVALDLADEKGKSAAQVAGSIITYLRRYSLAAAFGMYADEDTDGGNGKNDKKQQEPEAEKRVWTLQQKQAIVDAKLADHVNEAKAMLDHSVLKDSTGIVAVVSWAKHYRGARDEGKEVIEAAQVANDAYIAAKKGNA